MRPSVVLRSTRRLWPRSVGPARALPVRKSDRIFFVDLPNLDTRIEILRIHAAKRGIALDPATLASLGRACEGFAGAEIRSDFLCRSAESRHPYRNPENPCGQAWYCARPGDSGLARSGLRGLCRCGNQIGFSLSICRISTPVSKS